MKKSLIDKTLILLVLLIPCGALCQNQCPSTTMKGNDFWVTFLYNYHNTTSYNPGQLSLICIGDTNNTSVNISNNSTGTTNLNLNNSNNLHTTQVVAPNNQIIATPYNGGYHVTANHDIWLYAHNYIYNTQDIAAVFPTSALDTTYIVQDYPATSLGAQVAFVATEDNTVLTMTVPCAIYGTAITAGTTLTPTLMQGQSYLLLSNGASSSFSGMTVTSNGKPFAMFQGGRLISVPLNANGSDMIYEQGVSTNYWGTEFIVKGASPQSGNNAVRITSSADGCTITIDGNIVATLNAGQTLDYTMPASATKHIYTSQPAFVALYLTSYQYNSGDPSSITIPPLNRGICDSYFKLPTGGVSLNHKLVVICDANYDSGLRMDGTTLPTTNITTIDGYCVHLLTSSQGLHHLQNTQGPFIAYAYGLGSWESYGFFLGMALNPPEPPIYDTIVYYDTTCSNTAYNNYGFSLSPGGTGNIGTYMMMRDETIGTHHTHHLLYLTVMPVYYINIINYIAYGDTLIWNGQTLTVDGTYTAHLTSQYGCDSVVTLHLTFTGCDTAYLYDTICAGETYNNHDWILASDQLSVGDTVLSHMTTVGGVPTFCILRLTVLPVFSTEITESLINGDTLAYNDTLITLAGDYVFHLTATNGCDSTVILHIDYAAIGITASADGICPGEEVTITASGTHNYIWSSSPLDPELNSQQGTNPITVHPTITTEYQLLDGAGNVIASVTVNTAAPPSLCIETNKTFIDFDYPKVTFTDCSDGRYSSTWIFSDGITSHGEHVVRVFDHPLPDSVEITLISCNRYNCCTDTTFWLPCRIRSLWFPNIITPDAESNNLFRCYTSRDIVEFELLIFNRWGLQLWSTTDFEQGWDGRRSDGTPCTQGAYVYKYYWRDADGDSQSGIGTVTLILISS